MMIDMADLGTIWAGSLAMFGILCYLLVSGFRVALRLIR